MIGGFLIRGVSTICVCFVVDLLCMCMLTIVKDEELTEQMKK